MAHFFISYAREDTKTAKGLADLLHSEGFDVWWDPEIRIGEDFSDKIERAIWDAAHVIVLWSKHSVSSPSVQKEANMARGLGKLLQVNMEGCEIPRGFRGLHTVEFNGWEPLLEELHARLGRGSSAVGLVSPAMPRQTRRAIDAAKIAELRGEQAVSPEEPRPEWMVGPHVWKQWEENRRKERRRNTIIAIAAVAGLTIVLLLFWRFWPFFE